MRRFALSLPSALALAGIVFLAAGCKRPQAETAQAPVTPVAAKPEKADIDYAKIRPNELGQIPVLMYHEVGGKPYPRDPHLVRSVADFRKDLELLYEAGFRPVNLSDVVNNNIDIPAGTSPVVLTFDDARESQFRLIETADAMKIDPNSAVGVMDAFHKKHPDWRMRATFFVLPKSDRTMEPFGKPGLGQADDKFKYIVENGMELANHSTYHKDMSRMSPAQLQEEIGNAHNKILEAAPNAKLQVIALPMGKFPRDKNHLKYLLKGTYQGKTYEYKAAFLAAYRPMPSPVSKGYNPLKLERIGPADVRFGVRWWIKELSKGSGMYPRYISDGDPNVVSVPKGQESEVHSARVAAQGKTLYAYAPFGGSGGAKPIVGSAGNTDTPPADDAEAPAAVVTEKKPITGG